MSENIENIEIAIKGFRRILGNEIRTVREQKGLSQEQLAEMMEINSSTISKIENGKFSITVDYLARFSLYLDHEFRVMAR